MKPLNPGKDFLVNTKQSPVDEALIKAALTAITFLNCW